MGLERRNEREDNMDTRFDNKGCITFSTSPVYKGPTGNRSSHKFHSIRTDWIALSYHHGAYHRLNKPNYHYTAWGAKFVADTFTAELRLSNAKYFLGKGL